MDGAILVTGGAGFIGSHLVDRLLMVGHEVIVVDNLSRGSLDNIQKWFHHPNFLFYQLDLTANPELVFQNHRIRSVVHLAAMGRVRYSFENEAETYLSNVVATENVIKLCDEYDVSQLIFASTSSVYGTQRLSPFNESFLPNPQSPYAWQKLICEKMVAGLLRENCQTLILRLFSVYGPRQNPSGDHVQFIPASMRAISENQAPTIFGSGEQKRDFTYVGDVVSVMLKAIEIGGSQQSQILNVGTGVSTSINEVARLISEFYPHPIAWKRTEKIEEPFFTKADTTLLRRTLNIAPNTNLREKLKETIMWYCETCNIHV